MEIFFDVTSGGRWFFFSGELLKFSRQHVDWTVFFNDQNRYWQSICPFIVGL